MRKLWAEFELGKKPNYFDMRAFQGVGRGMPQDRPGEKLSDRVRNRPHEEPLVSYLAPVIPAPIHHRAVTFALGSLSAVSGDLAE